MIFNGKTYDNVQFTSTGEFKECEWSHNCVSIAANFMFALMSAMKIIKLYKERAVSAIVKEQTQIYYMNDVFPQNTDVLTSEQKYK